MPDRLEDYFWTFCSTAWDKAKVEITGQNVYDKATKAAHEYVSQVNAYLGNTP